MVLALKFRKPDTDRFNGWELIKKDTSKIGIISGILIPVKH